ncbi:MAG: hypothetical protein DMF51_00060, partial [Acidobacteria bacterium]
RRVVEEVRDPSIFFGFLSREGLPHPRTWCGARTPEVAGRTRCLWKGTRSGGGAKVRPAISGETRPRGHYLQERLAGSPGSAAFVADGTRAVLLGVTEQLSGFRELGGGGYRYGGNITGPPGRLLPDAALAVLRRAATSITRRFGLRGLNGLDFVLTSGTPHLIEVNPRYTASMELLEEMTGLNVVDLHLDAITDGRLSWPRASSTPTGVCKASTPTSWPGAAAAICRRRGRSSRPAIRSARSWRRAPRPRNAAASSPGGPGRSDGSCGPVASRRVC